MAPLCTWAMKSFFSLSFSLFFILKSVPIFLDLIKFALIIYIIIVYKYNICVNEYSIWIKKSTRPDKTKIDKKKRKKHDTIRDEIKNLYLIACLSWWHNYLFKPTQRDYLSLCCWIKWIFKIKRTKERGDERNW